MSTSRAGSCWHLNMTSVWVRARLEVSADRALDPEEAGTSPPAKRSVPPQQPFCRHHPPGLIPGDLMAELPACFASTMRVPSLGLASATSTIGWSTGSSTGRRVDAGNRLGRGRPSPVNLLPNAPPPPAVGPWRPARGNAPRVHSLPSAMLHRDLGSRGVFRPKRLAERRGRWTDRVRRARARLRNRS